MSNQNTSEKSNTLVVLDRQEMMSRAAVAATMVRHSFESRDCSKPLPLQGSETVKLGQLARLGSELYVVRHRHNAVRNGFAESSSDYEQVDSYYFIDSVQVPTQIEVYDDDLTYERSLLEEGHYDQLKYWLGEKEAIFAQQTHGATQREAQLLSRALNQL